MPSRRSTLKPPIILSHIGPATRHQGAIETTGMNSNSSVWVIIILLAVVGIFAYGIVKARRAREAHRARSDERAAAMLLAMHQETARSRAVPEPDRRDPSPRAAAAAPPVSAPVKHTLQRKPRLLEENQRLLYLVLRAAMTDHVIMANIRIADLVDLGTSPNYSERETKLRLLQQERIDCMVCTNELVPVAAVMIYDHALGVPEERVKTDALRELGMKFLRFRSDNLPKPAEMRGLILS